MSVNLLTEHHLECLSLTGGCRGSSESTLVKMSNCWKSHAAAHLILIRLAPVSNVIFFSKTDNLSKVAIYIFSWSSSCLGHQTKFD